jgi:penicillin-binding protein 2
VLSLSRIIPSMFHRRLVLLFCACVGAAGVLGVQTARLTVEQGEALRDQAEARLVRRSWVPTTRGRILDRHGRVLAADRPGYSLRVAYPVLTGEWARAQAQEQAKFEHADEWSGLSEDERAALVHRAEPFFERQVETMWREIAEATGIDRAELDRRAEGVVARVERMYASIVDRNREKAIEAAGQGGRTLTDEEMADIERRARTPIAEQLAAHEIVGDASDTVGFRFLRLAEQRVPVPSPRADGFREIPRMPGLEVRDATERVYPFDRLAVDVDRSTLPEPIRGDGSVSLEQTGIAWHLLGRMHDGATAESMEARQALLDADPAFRARVVTRGGVDRGRYFLEDAVGVAGVEGARESALRGLRGFREVHLDSGAVDEVEPTPGRDVYLTLDVLLQARVRAAMDPDLGLARVQPWHANEQMPVGTPIYGAAVVLDVDRAEILAMVSTPHVPREGTWFDDPAANERFMAINAPYVNRAIAKPYPPGSIAKALMLCGANQRGVLDLDRGIVCTGHLLPNRPDIFRCWIYKHYNGLTHSPYGQPLLAPEALERSCNIFFYTLGQRLGPMGVAAVYHEFGLGDGFDLGVGTEWPGKIGALDSTIGDGSDLLASDAILMGIGQGPVTWTPLHAADAYATIARAGYRVRPTLIADGGGSAPAEDLGIPRRAIVDALEGLSLSVNSQNGTGHHLSYVNAEGLNRREPIFTVPGVEVWGKTGTATAPDLRVDTDGDGPLPVQTVRSGDHSWYVVLVGPEGQGPRYAIAVVMDYAGSGGRVSGPIVNQIVLALRAEGYL